MPMMKILPAKTAFLHKNFRDLRMELKAIFLVHLATVIFCFLPWITYMPLYGSPHHANAFIGPTKMMGGIVFLVSLLICVFFGLKLFKYKKLKLNIPEETIFLFAGIEQLILLICIWSVLFLMGGGYDLAEIRFGLVFCLIFQIFGIVASYLLTRNQEKQEVISFFHQQEDNLKNLTEKAENLFTKKSAKK